MKKLNKAIACVFGVLAVILLSSTVSAGNGSGNEPPTSGEEAERSVVCYVLPFVCPVGTQGNGSGNEPDLHDQSTN